MSPQWMDPKDEAVPSKDAQLVKAVLSGERSAFDELVRLYQRQATSVAYRLLGNMDDALEVVQESFLRSYRNLPSLSQPERFKSWLLRIVANQSLNFRRARALRQGVSLEYNNEDSGEPSEMNRPDTSAVPAAEEASARELDRKIAAALDELPEKQRTALVLFSMENVPQKEVAQVLGISVEAVKWHVFTARKRLKERLKDFL